MISIRFLSALIALTYSPAVVFAASAAEVLKRAEVADKYVSYRGFKTATVHLGACCATATIKVVHLKPDKTRTQYFSPPLLAGVILIQDGPDMWKYHPREDEWEPVRFHGSLPVDVVNQRVFENYDIRLVGTDKIAGRQAYVVQAIPKRRGEPARRLWIDNEHYLIIGTQVESPSGSIVNSSRYLSVEFDPDDISPSVFRVDGKQRRAPKGPQSPTFRVGKPSYLPSGYRVVGMSCLSVNGASSSHLQFSNGVNTISLFQRKSDDTTGRSIKSKFTNVLTWVRDGMRFTLMGDIAKTELQKIADSVR